jgi:hypothetical protein
VIEEKTSPTIQLRKNLLQQLEQKLSSRMEFNRLYEQSSSMSDSARNRASLKDKNSEN